VRLGCELSFDECLAPVGVDEVLCIAQAGEDDRVAGSVVDRVVTFGYADDGDCLVASGVGVHGFPFVGLAISIVYSARQYGASPNTRFSKLFF
jgi:hypothetical protein